MGGDTRLRIAFLGLGTMGNPMATNLLKAGFPILVWNRTAAKAKPLQELGAKVMSGPAQAAAEADLIITMVSRPQDVEEVVMGPEGVLDGIKPGAVLVDMSTVTPSTSQKLAGALAAKQAEFLDAPVVGSKGPATEGRLVILVGGLPTTLDRCRGALSAMGRTIIHAGDVGKGAALKLATNLMLAHLVAGFSEALVLLKRVGVDPKRYLDVLEASTFSSPWYATKGEGILIEDFSVHFALKHMRKDLRLMSELADEAGAILPVTKAVEQLFARAEAEGRGEQDYSAIFASLSRGLTANNTGVT